MDIEISLEDLLKKENLQLG